jgi:hypothetical protein
LGLSLGDKKMNYKKNGERLPIKVGDVFVSYDNSENIRTMLILEIKEIKPKNYIEHVFYSLSRKEDLCGMASDDIESNGYQNSMKFMKNFYEFGWQFAGNKITGEKKRCIHIQGY